jgi:phosphoglycerol transferase MdoB-like AlkP superfamily enzyme
VGDDFWQLAVPPAALGLALTYLIELHVVPKVASARNRVLAAHCTHTGIWLLVFTLELAVFRRPWLAAANAIALFYVLVLISNAKFIALREPIIYQDIDYCLDVLKHPRLYLPFLGVHRSLLGAGGIVLALYIGVKTEPNLLGTVALPEFLTGLAFLMILGVLLLWWGSRKGLTASYEPTKDLQQLGLMGSLWRYAVSERVTRNIASPYVLSNHAMRGNVQEFPHLVVVQSESFFDVRRLSASVQPNVLREYDTTKKMATHHGQLEVPAWGANTVRSEFAFLSAIAPAALGVHQFNPYRKLARHGFPTLASFLKSLGYHTVCVHPYSAEFYNRNVVYPRLGFDEFIDIRSFDDTQKSGPFIGDIALAERVCTLLRTQAARSIFVFVITMENHGPLHLEKVSSDDVSRLYSALPPDGCDDLTVYLRHLCNADRMLGTLRRQLEALSRPAALCWYGDHLPIMPKVYEAIGAPNGNTDYLIWQTNHAPAPDVSLDLKIEDLSLMLLRKMGLTGTISDRKTNLSGWP